MNKKDLFDFLDECRASIKNMTEEDKRRIKAEFDSMLPDQCFEPNNGIELILPDSPFFMSEEKQFTYSCLDHSQISGDCWTQATNRFIELTLSTCKLTISKSYNCYIDYTPNKDKQSFSRAVSPMPAA